MVISAFFKNKWFLFFFLFGLLFLLFNYPYALKSRPGVTHQWAQTDRLSFATTYYENHSSFFEPEILWIGNKGNGKTVSEMPLIYYVAAKIWSITGKSEFVLRLIFLLIIILALVLWFSFLNSFLGNIFTSLFIVILLFTSPSLVYYSLGFLTDVPALAFCMIGWICYFRYYSSQKNNRLYLAIALFTLGALIKFSAIISMISLGLLYFLYLLSFDKKNSQRFFCSPFPMLISSVISMCFIFGWYSFALNYNSNNSSGVFLTNVLPIWEYNSHEINSMFQQFKNTGLYNFYGSPVLIIIPILFCIVLFSIRKVVSTHPIFLITCFLFLLSVFSMLLWFKNLHHDYYLLQQCLTVLMLLASSAYILKHNFRWFSHGIFKSCCIAFLLWNIGYASIKHTIRFITIEDKKIYSWFVNPPDIRFDQQALANYNNRQKVLETIEPFLRSLGIKPTDRVISSPDVTPNTTLYLMNQRGFTEFGRDIHSKDVVDDLIKNYEAKYLVLTDTALNVNDGLSFFTKNRIGNYKNAVIYKLQ